MCVYILRFHIPEKKVYAKERRDPNAVSRSFPDALEDFPITDSWQPNGYSVLDICVGRRKEGIVCVGKVGR